MEPTDQLRDACKEAVIALQKLKDAQFNELQSNLEYCIGSYNYDQNPSGLYENGRIALDKLKEIKKQYPRKVNKKVIENLEKELDK